MPEISTYDVVERTKAALDRSPCPCGERECNRPNPRQLARLVPELVAEVERLRGLNAALQVGQSNLQVLLSDAHATDEPADPHAGGLWANELERRTRQVAPGEWS